MKSNPINPARAQLLAARAASMRAALTPSEERLWQAIRAQKLGASFRRQVVIGSFIVDFCAPAARLVLEVDGSYHAQRLRADARRDRRLEAAGYRVLRLSAQLVLGELPLALQRITEALAAR